MKRIPKPFRTATLCVFRFRHFYYPAAGGQTATRTGIEPLRVILSCGHPIMLGEWPRKYLKKEHRCARCAELFPRVIIEATRRREAMLHHRGQCRAACPLCHACSDHVAAAALLE